MSDEIFDVLEKLGVDFEELHDQIMEGNALDSRTKRLLAIASAASKGCDFCVQHHVERAREEDIDEGEIAEALLVSAMVGFGSNIQYLGQESVDPE